MANIRSILALLFLSNFLISVVIAGRDIPANPNKADVKQPESLFLDHDRSFLVPGIGRYMFPDVRKGFNPFTYNPITGTDGGNGISVPGDGARTLVPNVGVEVRIPGIGGNVAAARP